MATKEIKPAKRRITISTGENLDVLRNRSLEKFKQSFEAIIRKYERIRDENEDDEINLETGVIEVDRGVLRRSEAVKFGYSGEFHHEDTDEDTTEDLEDPFIVTDSNVHIDDFDDDIFCHMLRSSQAAFGCVVKKPESIKDISVSNISIFNSALSTSNIIPKFGEEVISNQDEIYVSCDDGIDKESDFETKSIENVEDFQFNEKSVEIDNNHSILESEEEITNNVTCQYSLDFGGNTDEFGEEPSLTREKLLKASLNEFQLQKREDRESSVSTLNSLIITSKINSTQSSQLPLPDFQTITNDVNELCDSQILYSPVRVFAELPLFEPISTSKTPIIETNLSIASEFQIIQSKSNTFASDSRNSFLDTCPYTKKSTRSLYTPLPQQHQDDIESDLKCTGSDPSTMSIKKFNERFNNSPWIKRLLIHQSRTEECDFTDSISTIFTTPHKLSLSAIPSRLIETTPPGAKPPLRPASQTSIRRSARLRTLTATMGASTPMSHHVPIIPGSSRGVIGTPMASMRRSPLIKGASMIRPSVDVNVEVDVEAWLLDADVDNLMTPMNRKRRAVWDKLRDARRDIGRVNDLEPKIALEFWRKDGSSVVSQKGNVDLLTEQNFSSKAAAFETENMYSDCSTQSSITFANCSYKMNSENEYTPVQVKASVKDQNHQESPKKSTNRTLKEIPMILIEIVSPTKRQKISTTGQLSPILDDQNVATFSTSKRKLKSKDKQKQKVSHTEELSRRFTRSQLISTEQVNNMDIDMKIKKNVTKRLNRKKSRLVRKSSNFSFMQQKL
ncbi:hypothetical protein HK096_006661 [Nowakowskiella sp. JEL0078]|nr:hypothetical protein HK096_006661 [Nowakowskiella sp. JEL0078]